MGKSAKHVRTKDGKSAIEFYDENGNKTSTNVGGARPWRNNNPGNLVGGKGAIGRDSEGFAIFPDMETGRQAQAAVIKNDSRYKGKSIKDMIPVYVDPNDPRNDIAGYTKDIGDFSGLDMNKKLEDLSDEESGRLLDAIRRREGAIDKQGNPKGAGTVINHSAPTMPSAPTSGQGSDAVVERMKTLPPTQFGKPPAPLPTASEWPKVDSSAFPAAQDAPITEEPGWWDKAKEFIPSLVSPAHGGTFPGSDGMAPPASTENGLVAVTEEERRYMTDDQKRLLDMSAAPIANPGQAALLKPVEKLTQPEMMDMIHSAQGDYRGWRSGDPLKAHTYEKVQDWHTAMYGDAPQGNDGGKPIDPMPIRAIPDQSAPHVTPQGEDLWQATGRIGKQVVEVGQAQGMGNAVTSLQRGLNMLNAANPLPDRSPAYAPYTKLGQIAEDGAYGPQTDFALKHATARLGPNKVEDGFALGRFNTFARNAQRRANPDGLENATHGAFGSLFRDPADSKAPKLEGGVLQETLNDLGSRNHDDWEPLKVDNWIGPKTTDAFGKVLRTEDADSFTSAFGRGLGLL